MGITGPKAGWAAEQLQGRGLVGEWRRVDETSDFRQTRQRYGREIRERDMKEIHEIQLREAGDTIELRWIYGADSVEIRWSVVEI